MTWQEFKEKVELDGVQNLDEIVYIDISCSRPDKASAEVFVRPDGSRSFHVN